MQFDTVISCSLLLSGLVFLRFLILRTRTHQIRLHINWTEFIAPQKHDICQRKVVVQYTDVPCDMLFQLECILQR